jgi:molybdopterin/thiamine biosynthesis adenylyltransferase
MGSQRLTDTQHEETWPESLRAAASNLSKRETDAAQPVIIKMGRAHSQQELTDLVTNQPIWAVTDNYDEQLAELYVSQNAHLYRANPDVKAASIKDYLKEHYAGKSPWQLGSWVYYPWSGQLVHILAEQLFWDLRTIRNKSLISAEEQEKYANFRAGCLGMSVGSSGAIALVLQGGSKQLKIADGAVISGSNLNRIRTGIEDVGRNKAVVISRQLYEMNPYIEVQSIQKSVRPGDISEFFEEPWPLDVIVDEIDDLETKIRIRIEARKRRLPVLMATDLGDDVMLDVERYDLDPSLPLFHGLAGKIEDVLSKKEMTQREWMKHAVTIIGVENVALRMQKALLEVGTRLPTQPQLGGTAAMAGSVVSYAIRKLALGENLKSGRTMISLDHHLLPDSKRFKHRYTHRRHTQAMRQALDSM